MGSNPIDSFQMVRMKAGIIRAKSVGTLGLKYNPSSSPP
jgi:hypothetical protein